MSKKGEQPTTTKTTPSSSSRRHRWTFDPTWLILCIILGSTIAVALSINKTHDGITVDKMAETIDIDDGDTHIEWSHYQTVDIDLNGSLNIAESGTYHLTGTLQNGNIIIDAGVSEVRLILDNVSLSSISGPAIYCKNAEDLVIELIGDNFIQDGYDYSAGYDEDVKGAIYSKSDLIFQGVGTLTLNGNYQDAIIGKDDVKFNSGSYNIKAADDAIHGKDSIYIAGGNLAIESVADSLKTTNEADFGKGFVLVTNGNLNLISSKGKGIEAVKNIIIQGGRLAIDSFNDAIHSDNNLGISAGWINIHSGDDGIHADREMIVDGGDIYVSKAYEGIEAQVVNINNGNISIYANDDGINAGGGVDQSSRNHTNSSQPKTDEDCVVSINNGSLYINSAGDGIDSNGWLYVNGGDVIVDGPIDDKNNALDSSMGTVLNGGSILAVGSSGLAENINSASNNHSISIFLTERQPANTNIVIKDSEGNDIIQHLATKSFGHITASSNDIKVGHSYSLYLNNEKYADFTIFDTTTVVDGTAQNLNNA